MSKKNDGLTVLIRTYADMLGAEWYFNGRLDDEDKRENARDFAKTLKERFDAFAGVSEARLYRAICESLRIEIGGGIDG